MTIDVKLDGQCPACGHCKHCGRGGPQPVPSFPFYPQYPQPWFIPYTVPTFQAPYWTCTVTSTTAATL